VNDSDAMVTSTFIGNAVDESPMLRPRTTIFLGSKLTSAGKPQEGAKSAHCRSNVVAVADAGTVTDAVIVTRKDEVEPLPLARSGSKMFTTTGDAPEFTMLTDMPVKVAPVDGSEALIPPLEQLPLVNGVP